MLSQKTSREDPLQAALRRKSLTRTPGAAVGATLAAGSGWRVVDIVCTSGPRDRTFEEQHRWASISLVLRGSFIYRSGRRRSLMAPGALLLGSPGGIFECSHEHGEGGRCLSFQYDPDVFEKFAHDAGSRRFAFAATSLPPLRKTAPITARAAAALLNDDSFEEIAMELAGAALREGGQLRRGFSEARQPHAITKTLRLMEDSPAAPHPLDELARAAGLSPYHFLRTFKAVTGVTPHQWLLRTRLRDAAKRLATSRDPITDIALDSGFGDLSNFIRSFRAEFGRSPRQHRAAS